MRATDIDDLRTTEQLEESVQQSATVLVVLSKRYFMSSACRRELRAAREFKKPIVLLHEANHDRGGAPLAEILQESEVNCPEFLRLMVMREGSAIKIRWPLIRWHRLRELQVRVRIWRKAYLSNP